MDRPGDELLSRAAFPRDQDRDITFSHLADEFEHLLHGRTLADDLPDPAFLPKFAGDGSQLSP